VYFEVLKNMDSLAQLFYNQTLQSLGCRREVHNTFLRYSEEVPVASMEVKPLEHCSSAPAILQRPTSPASRSSSASLGSPNDEKQHSHPPVESESSEPVATAPRASRHERVRHRQLLNRQKKSKDRRISEKHSKKPKPRYSEKPRLR